MGVEVRRTGSKGRDGGDTHENDIEALRPRLESLERKLAILTALKGPIILAHVGGKEHHIDGVILNLCETR
jgi:hypothetical protein